MTDYTKTKRALQKIGFKIFKRFEDKHVVLFDGKYFIELNDTSRGLKYHACTTDGTPVSWHHNGFQMWVGENGKICRTAITGESLWEIFWIMGCVAHWGHYRDTYHLQRGLGL